MKKKKQEKQQKNTKQLTINFQIHLKKKKKSNT